MRHGGKPLMTNPFVSLFRQKRNQEERFLRAVGPILRRKNFNSSFCNVKQIPANCMKKLTILQYSILTVF